MRLQRRAATYGYGQSGYAAVTVEKKASKIVTDKILLVIGNNFNYTVADLIHKASFLQFLLMTGGGIYGAQTSRLDHSCLLKRNECVGCLATGERLGAGSASVIHLSIRARRRFEAS